MEMNHREPQAGHSDEFAGAPDGRAVWESELPWQLPHPDQAGEGSPLYANHEEHAAEEVPPTNPDATAVRPVAHAPASDATAARPAAHGPVPDATAVLPVAHAPVSGTSSTHAPAGTSSSGAEGGSTVRRTSRPATSPQPTGGGGRRRRSAGAGGRRPGSRGHLAKPILAGAGLLSALLLLAPHLFGDDAPLQTVKAGAEDREPETGTAPDPGHPDAAKTSPRPAASTTRRGEDSAGGGHDAIVEVAATVPTASAKPTTGPTAAPSATRSATPTKAAPAPTATTEQWTTTVVNGTRVLDPGQLWSTNRIGLNFQGDGNLVLYDTKGTPLWWSGTVGQGGVRAVFQADGNLAVYSQDSRTVWSSHTEGHDGARLVLRADGNVVIEQGGTVLWSTGTAM
ncbi:hypothetical protein [Streptomyces sp. NPDC060184]|uniref:hypothetical protein n=1 Tax=Streptomyces sp. NPDC060184 TaxID=3347064 RepID=UPI003657FC47